MVYTSNVILFAACLLFVSSCFGEGCVDRSKRTCKCGPEDPCWPSQTQWDALNSTVSGKLIRNVQPAKVCYPGSAFDARDCKTVTRGLSNSTFIADNTVALCYPVDVNPCPPVKPSGNVGETGTCRIGYAPRYTVNATNPKDVSRSIKFANQHNLRVVVRNTGHDILGRSTGYGSLQIWIRHLRNGISYHKNYNPLDGCTKTKWSGHAFTVRGGYVWSDVYAEADARDLLVVGGGDPSVGVVSGWMLGGGHSPATHDYGLGADQVLEAQVVLANGRMVTTNACQNPDLFFAIRGGGPGWGVVTSTTIKAYPTVNVTSQSLSFAPLNDKAHHKFMDAIAEVYSSFPRFSDHGYSGYGAWTIASPTPLFANFTAGYTHTIAMFGRSIREAKRVAQPLIKQLLQYNGTSLFVTVSYEKFSAYKYYYLKDSGVQQPVGSSAALGSRFLDRDSLVSNCTSLKNALNTIAGLSNEYTQNNIIFVGGGAVKQIDPTSGINPAWRTAYVHQIVARGWAPGSSKEIINAVHHDITYKKIGALRKLAPHTGSYMNEADRRDQLYEEDFYGKNLAKLLAIKHKYDPTNVFFCVTCVGSGEWEFRNNRLCRR